MSRHQSIATRFSLIAGVVAAALGASCLSSGGAAAGSTVGLAGPPSMAGLAVPGVFPVPSHFVKPADAASRPYVAKATTWPADSSATLTMVAPASGKASAKVVAAGSPVWAQPQADEHGRYPGPGAVTVHVLDHAKASAAGIDGVLMTVAPAGAAQGGPVRVGLDYSGFAQAYGGNYGQRLRLIAYPRCVLTSPSTPSCRVAIPLASANDAAAQSVSAPVALAGATSTADASAGRMMVLAAVSDPGTEGGTGGSYAATTLKPSGSWSSGGSTGSFDYTYPISAPAASTALVPRLDLGYDSGSVDGQTAATQAQASWVGDGWSLPDSYIEQSFISCSDNPEGTASPVSTSDECYDGPILTLSLNGSSTSLVWDASKLLWKVADDNSGAVVAHVTNSSNGTGTYNTDYWTVTERDGTVYYFGRNELPGWSSGKATTNSVDTEPVYSAHSGDPCYNSAGFTSSVCTMGYRWHLDYVTSVGGRAAMAYYYSQDTNYYGRDNGTSNVPYIRDSHLARIDYGFTDGGAYGTVPDQVVFTPADRCVSGTCDPLNSTTKANWPDVPFDLVCASGATCNSYAPSFFSTVRLASITMQQYSTATSQYVPVDSWALTQTLPATGDSTSPTLWLASIAHTGSDLTGGGSSTSITLPPVSFTGVDLANRVDTATDGLPPLYRYRIATITTETGSVISPIYEQTAACTAPVTLTPSTNTSSCYPVYWTPTGYTQPYLDWFNRYVVQSVTQTDPTGGAPTVQISYAYPHGAAWHYDDNEVVQLKYRTYGQFRGYGDVQTFTGDGVNDPKTESETTYYRGMSDDNNTTAVTLTDSAGGGHDDANQLAGQALETTAYLGAGGPVDHSTITSYWVSAATATRTRSGLPALTANRTAPVESYTRQALTDGGTSTWRNTETDTAYDATTTDINFGVATHVYTHTVPANSAYDSCTTTSYAPANATANLVGLASEVETDRVACGGFTQGSPASVPGSVNALTAPAGVNRPAQVASDARSFYDDPTFSTTFPQASALTKGDVTMVQKAADFTSGFVYSTIARSTYDAYGRASQAWDGNGNLTATTYTVNSVGLTTGVTVTNPLSQTTSQTYDTERNLPLTQTDANSVLTTTRYDALGRTTGVWLNSRATTASANYVYSYTLSNTGITAATAQKLNDEGGYQTSTLIYDAMLRPRQTQTITPQSGRLVTDTFYDTHGWTHATYNGWWDSATLPNTTLVSAATLHDSVPNEDFYTQDGLGRTVVDASAKDGVTVATTITVYNGDRTTVIPPTGGVTQSALTDPLGRKSELDQYTAPPTLSTPSNTFTGIFSVSGGTTTATQYLYDSHGDQATVKDATGAAWTSTFNLLGQATAKSDPDAGNVTGITYDNDGNLLQATDSRGKTISTTYDALNRKIGQYDAPTASQSSSNMLASWVYDNSNNAIAGMKYPIGHLTTATSYNGGAAYVEQQNNFNIFGESTGETVTIPAATEGNLGASYTFTHIYTATTGLALKDGYPLAGGLPSETVLYGYNGALDLPNTVGGLTGYAGGTTYDPWGRVTYAKLNSSPNLAAVTDTYDLHTSKLTDQLLTRAVATPGNVDEQAYTYDLAGNATAQTDTRLGSTSTSETQCYTYDAVDRLNAAWTATDNCAAIPSSGSHATVGDNLGAASTYWTTWSYDNLGNRTQQDQHATGSGTDSITTYTYNGNGTNQPHTLTSTNTTGGTTSSTSYGYDSAGNMTSRTTPAQGAQTLTWNDAGQLTANNTSNYVYDANGTLLIQKDPGTSILYLPGEQISLNTTTQTTTGTRYYPLPGGATAVRTGTGTAYGYELASDQHGTNTVSLDATAQTPTWRQDQPFGDPRGTTINWIDNRGFLNKPADASTGLTEIGARQYDTATGRFISDDPVLETTDPQQLNGYSYAGDNPVGNSDPSGLMLPKDPDIGGFQYYPGGADYGSIGYVPNGSGNIGTFVGSIGAGIVHSLAKFGDTVKDSWLGPIFHNMPDTLSSSGPIINVNPQLPSLADPVDNFAVSQGASQRVINDTSNTIDVLSLAVGGEGMAKKLLEGDGIKAISSLLKGGCGLHSFKADTRVLMADGTTRPIENVKVGDKIENAEPGGHTEQSRVDQIHKTLTDTDFTDLTVNTPSGLQVITSTQNHPYYDLTTGQFTNAAQLNPGDRLQTDGATAVIVAAVNNYVSSMVTYDLTIDGLHTYYVVAGDTPVLVHNEDGCGPRLALGLESVRGSNPTALNKFAAANDAVTYKDPMFNDLIPRGVATQDALGKMIDRVVEKGGTIHFNLEGVQNIDEILKGADYGQGYTSFELRYICTNAGVRAATTFYGGSAPC